MKINEMIDTSKRTLDEIITDLTDKTIEVPSWEGRLQKEYDPKLHPVNDKAKYPDIVHEDGSMEFVSRVSCALQKLSVKRMNELVYGIPVKRVYDAKNDRQKEIAKYIENIFKRTRIDSVNVERGTMLFASCEVMTLWYAVEDKNNIYGFDSDLKLRCRHFSPKNGDALYPLYDESGDLVALSILYQRKVLKNNVEFFDCYTADRHLQFRRSDAVGDHEWTQTELSGEAIRLGKIPAVYCYREEPIWEDTSNIVNELEWNLSRNGNYIRKNSKPLFGVFSDEAIMFGSEKEGNNESRSILQFPKGADARYISWAQATDSLAFQQNELRTLFWTQLQLPDWSYEQMKATPMSGEARKQLFIDCQMKVKDESGRLLEMHDREVNVVKAFLKAMLPESYHADIDALPVESAITAFTINEDKELVEVLLTANGGKPLMSQRESIERLGWSDDTDATKKEIDAEQQQAAMELANIQSMANGE